MGKECEVTLGRNGRKIRVKIVSDDRNHFPLFPAPIPILPIQLTLDQCRHHLYIHHCPDRGVALNGVQPPWVSVIVDTVTTPNPTTNPASRRLSGGKLHTHRNATFTGRCRHNQGGPQVANTPGHHYPAPTTSIHSVSGSSSRAGYLDSSWSLTHI